MKITILLLLSAIALAPAQPGGGRAGNPGAITGQVYDSEYRQPVEYANIVVYRLRDSTQVNGTVSGPNGRFEVAGLPPGRYYVEVTFIGYRPRTVTDLELAPGAAVDIGRIDLRQAVVAVEGAEVVAERPTLTYEIDKKVIDVGGLATAASGTAVDVLENVPTVKVDIEGNVSLRGSENFTVLVDGRLSPLDPSDALQTIPAASIDRVEIITNPSARYDPDGVSGIINVILKQQRGSGLSGVLNGNLGLGNRYGTSGQLTWTSGIVTLQAGADYSRREGPGTRESWRSTR
ncbi:MAG: TonB-dependent receptor [bacterium]